MLATASSTPEGPCLGVLFLLTDSPQTHEVKWAGHAAPQAGSGQTGWLGPQCATPCVADGVEGQHLVGRIAFLISRDLRLPFCTTGVMETPILEGCCKASLFFFM